MFLGVGAFLLFRLNTTSAMIPRRIIPIMISIIFPTFLCFQGRSQSFFGFPEIHLFYFVVDCKMKLDT